MIYINRKTGVTFSAESKIKSSYIELLEDEVLVEDAPSNNPKKKVGKKNA